MSNISIIGLILSLSLYIANKLFSAAILKMFDSKIFIILCSETPQDLAQP